MHGQDEATQGDNDDTQYFVDNLDQVEDYMAVSYSVFEGYNKESFDALQADFIALQVNHPATLLLDSCSTLNLLADELLLDNIHEVEHTMHVKCNARVTSTNLMGRFGDFPEPVWYNPNGIYHD
jgi:hypothetical protein